MNDCIFCKIVAKEIPCYKVYENEKVLAFLDLFPINKGHCLVIPKEHHTNIFCLPPDLLQEITLTGQKIARAIQEIVKPDGMNLQQSNEKAAGQEIFHYHLHLVPRFFDDGVKLPMGGEKGNHEELQSLAQEIALFLGQASA